MTAFGPANILDLGVRSLAVTHDWPVGKGAAIWLEFNWSGRLMRIDCEVRTSRYSRADAKYRSGLIVSGGPAAAEFEKRVRTELEKAGSRDRESVGESGRGRSNS